METRELNIQWRDLSVLKPYEKNPRKIDKAIPIVKNSIGNYGYKNPIIVNSEGVILAGHTRFEALLDAGYTKAQVIVADDLNEIEERGFRIMDNKSAEYSGWEHDLLNAELEAIKLDMPDFDLSSITGFSDKELRKRIDTSAEGEDDAPETHETDIKRGDLFLLGGKHRLLCGDSTSETDIARLMDGAKADVVFTDPPYGMHLNTDFYHSLGGPDRQAERKIHARSKNYPKVTGDDKDYDPAHIFRDFGDAREIFLWGADYYAERLVNKNKGSWFVWDKRAGIENAEFSLSEFELCWSKRKHHRKILRYSWFGVYGLQFEKDEYNGSAPPKRVHPNQKPVRMLDWFVNEYTKEGEIVWDGFLGSGSTIIACDKNDRVCYGLEIEPEYCQVIIDRWKKFTKSDDVKKVI